MPDPKKRQRFFDFMYENCLTVSMIRDAVKQLEKASIKPQEFNMVIGQYADYYAVDLEMIALVDKYMK